MLFGNTMNTVQDNELDKTLERFENNKISPIYEKLKMYIIEKICSREWPVNHRIPSESELVKLLQCSRMTVNRALRELTAEGYLLRIQGVGTFVTENKAHSSLLEIKNIAEEIAERGNYHHSKVLVLEEIKVLDRLLIKMKLHRNDTVYSSLIVHYENNIPIQLERKYVNPAMAPTYLSQDFERDTTNAYLVKVAPLSKGQHIVKAAMPSKEQADLLIISEHEPCLLIERTTWSNEVIVSYSELLYPADRYYLEGTF